MALNAFFRRQGALVAAVAVVVAALVYLSGDGGSHATLPSYTVASVGSARGSLELVAGPLSTFELVVRPTAHVPTKVVAYVFAIGEGEPNAVDAKTDVTPEGEVRIAGRARALAGAREVRVVIGPATAFKRFEDAVVRAREGTGDDRIRVVVVPIVRQR